MGHTKVARGEKRARGSYRTQYSYESTKSIVPFGKDEVLTNIGKL